MSLLVASAAAAAGVQARTLIAEGLDAGPELGAALRRRRVEAIESAVRAIKMGAFDFIEKPLSLDKTVLVARNALRQRRLEAENRALRAHVDRRLVMIGESLVMQQLHQQSAKAAPP